MLRQAGLPIETETMHGFQDVNLAETLRIAIAGNPFLKVYVVNGYYDLATPYLATRYMFTHLGLDRSLQDNFHVDYFEAGHMMFIHIPSLVKLRADLVDFIRWAIPQASPES